jgi:hypothetical protein
VELTLIELSQMSDSDSDDGGGRRLKILKPIFNKTTQDTVQEQTVKTPQPTPVAPVTQRSDGNTAHKTANSVATPISSRFPMYLSILHPSFLFADSVCIDSSFLFVNKRLSLFTRTDEERI